MGRAEKAVFGGLIKVNNLVGDEAWTRTQTFSSKPSVWTSPQRPWTHWHHLGRSVYPSVLYQVPQKVLPKMKIYVQVKYYGVAPRRKHKGVGKQDRLREKQSRGMTSGAISVSAWSYVNYPQGTTLRGCPLLRKGTGLSYPSTSQDSQALLVFCTWT